ncbi:MAG TPA: lipocalin-like domain-containing protein [Steroidobacteraceae bacterium]|jgi:predicted secreted hydrolase|nr:lipocalin-like domain-containing protein [Steroidobacteraceae bacterium]
MPACAKRVLLSLASVLVGLSLDSCERPTPARTAAAAVAAPVQVDRLSILRAADESGFALADAPRHFEFPLDHGPHPRFRHEWWYFTGQLRGGGETFGFELTIFRLALRPPQPLEAIEASSAPPSAWRARQVYAAHFAITDVSHGRFFNATRYARDALNLAGAQAQPFAIHVADWSVSEVAGAPALPLHWQLQAADGDYRLQLDLRSAQPPVLNGAAGLSRKADAPGAASYYYSMPRLQAAGAVSRKGRRVAVSGVAWLDREWGSGSLGVDQRGWDWFALDLDDGSSLMFYALRDGDGRRDAHSAGTFVDAAGHVTPLRNDDVRITVLRHWNSPRGGQYPAQWSLQVGSQQLQLKVTPLLADQEMLTLPRYWEGAVQVTGQRHGMPVGAQGYVELVGYAQNQASASTPSAKTPPAH